MVSLTENEAKTLDFLIRNFSIEYNINRLANALGISPGGMFKILRKLEKQGFLTEKRQAITSFTKLISVQAMRWMPASLQWQKSPLRRMFAYGLKTLSL